MLSFPLKNSKISHGFKRFLKRSLDHLHTADRMRCPGHGERQLSQHQLTLYQHISALMDGGTVASLSIKWDVTLKEDYPHVMSRKFRFRDKEWFMTCGLSFTVVDSRSYQFVVIKLHWVGGSLELPIAVSVRVWDVHTGNALPTLSEAKQGVIEDESQIWSKSVEDVARADSYFRRYSRLIFRVTLGDKDSGE